MWIYQTSKGIIRIFFNGQNYSLFVFDDVYGFYPSPIAAADDVYTFTTGNYNWDSLEGIIEPPESIDEWVRIK